MVCMVSSVGRSTPANRSLRHAAMPSGMPASSDRNTATPISASVAKPCCHRSVMPMSTTPQKPSAPASRPRTRHSPRPQKTGYTYHGNHRRIASSRRMPASARSVSGFSSTVYSQWDVWLLMSQRRVRSMGSARPKFHDSGKAPTDATKPTITSATAAAANPTANGDRRRAAGASAPAPGSAATVWLIAGSAPELCLMAVLELC